MVLFNQDSQCVYADLTAIHSHRKAFLKNHSENKAVGWEMQCCTSVIMLVAMNTRKHQPEKPNEQTEEQDVLSQKCY